MCLWYEIWEFSDVMYCMLKKSSTCTYIFVCIQATCGFSIFKLKRKRNMIKAMSLSPKMYNKKPILQNRSDQIGGLCRYTNVHVLDLWRASKVRNKTESITYE